MAPIDEYDLGDVVNGLAAINTTLIHGFALLAAAVGSRPGDAPPLEVLKQAASYVEWILPK